MSRDDLTKLKIELNDRLTEAEHDVDRLRRDVVRMVGLDADNVDADELMVTSMRLVRAVDKLRLRREENQRILNAMAGI